MYLLHNVTWKKITYLDSIDFKSIETIFIEEDNDLIPYKLKRIKHLNKKNLTLIINEIDCESKVHGIKEGDILISRFLLLAPLN